METVVKVVDSKEIVLIRIPVNPRHEEELVDYFTTPAIEKDVNKPGPVIHRNRVKRKGIDKHCELGSVGSLKPFQPFGVDAAHVGLIVNLSLMELSPLGKHLGNQVV